MRDARTHRRTDALWRARGHGGTGAKAGDAPTHRRTDARWLLAAVALAFAGTGVLPAQETSLTVYSDGRVLVRRAVPIAVPRGASTFAVDLGARTADLGSLVSLDDGVEIRGARVVAAAGPEASLRRALGREIDFMRGGDSLSFVRGTLLSLDPPAVRVNGRVMYQLPGIPAFPDSLVRLAPEVLVTVEAARPQPSLRMAFLASGLQWAVDYAVTVPRSGPGRGAVTGQATVNNPGSLSFRAAEVQLLAGEVRRAPEGGLRMQRGLVAPRVMAAEATPLREAVGETHVYTLPGTIEIIPGESRLVALFPRAEAPVEPEYLLRPSAFGPLARWPAEERDLHADISYLVRRPSGTAFGNVPLPAGTARVFAPDSAGRLQLLGEAAIAHTPTGRELHLSTGTAFDITGQRTQLTFEQRGRREVVASYRIAIQNAKDDSVTVQVLDQFPGDWELLSSTVRGERLSASTIRFPVPVPAGGEASLEYRVRVRW